MEVFSLIPRTFFLAPFALYLEPWAYLFDFALVLLNEKCFNGAGLGRTCARNTLIQKFFRAFFAFSSGVISLS